MNNVNYDQQLNSIVNNLNGTVPKLLLHVCCAPCATYCLTQLIQHFDVTLFYDNSNITNKAEWDKRLCEVKKLTDIVNNGQFAVSAVCPLKLVVADFDSQSYFNAVFDLHNEPEGGKRCECCFKLRLGNTFKYAQRNGFDYFGTTLTVSPYKNAPLINQIGLSLQSADTLFLPSDFKKREGYKQSVALSNKYGLYRQHYCGCVFSQNEQN